MAERRLGGTLGWPGCVLATQRAPRGGCGGGTGKSRRLPAAGRGARTGAPSVGVYSRDMGRGNSREEGGGGGMVLEPCVCAGGVDPRRAGRLLRCLIALGPLCAGIRLARNHLRDARKSTCTGHQSINVYVTWHR
jgi:hypothetical protein